MQDTQNNQISGFPGEKNTNSSHPNLKNMNLLLRIHNLKLEAQNVTILKAIFFTKLLPSQAYCRLHRGFIHIENLKTLFGTIITTKSQIEKTASPNIVLKLYMNSVNKKKKKRQ